ncbi:hypothetical protein [Actomonas aquatica]|uniref:Lipoprotein n=1 Tax=Actomonas aquatica TaxID=2866162 RepID=A0ABZ1C6N3_9BACT|nr:hypothetical protein [Opitutus sp. WL0086]WRQ86992.1 hypothetical protein K1X11_019435 [Opitutus sp. WL0086]
MRNAWIKWGTLVVVGMGVLATVGCRSFAPSTSHWSEAETLAENDRVPREFLSQNYGSTWLRIADIRYDAAVWLAGSVDTEGGVHFHRTLEDVVDARHLQLARSLLPAVELPRSAVGEIRGRAEVQMFFYESDRAQTDVLIVAWRKQRTPYGESRGKNFFCRMVTL